MVNLVEIAGRLKEERKARGQNQAEFGALGGVGLQTQSRYEKADTEPGALYLARLAESGVDVVFVLTGRRGGELMSPETSRAASALERMPQQLREAMVVILDAGASIDPEKIGHGKSRPTLHDGRTSFKSEE